MYIYVDAEGNVKIDKKSILLVPEFKEIVDSPLYGWNYMQYVVLFTCRTPYGMLPEEIRNQKVTVIVQSMPWDSGAPTKGVDNFFKNEKFAGLSNLLRTLHPDDIYDAYLVVSKKINLLIGRIDKLDIGESVVDDDLAQNLVYLDIYQKNLESLQKQKRLYESMMKDRTTIIRADHKAGSIKRNIERKRSSK